MNTSNSSGFHSENIQVNGVTLNVIIEGRGPDVLLIHGFPDSKEIWSRQIPALVAAGYRVIAPDTRGIGDSQLLPARSDYQLPKLIEDMRALLAALNIDKVRLVGHDWGAVIGWQLAMTHPELIERYAALSVGHPLAYMYRGGLAQKLKGWYTLFFQLPILPEFSFRIGNWATLRKLLDNSPELDGHIQRLSRPGRLTAGINYYRANIFRLMARKWPAVTVPVMGVYSSGDDYLTEQQMRNSAQLVEAGFRYEQIEGCGHWMQVEAPEKVNALLLDFLQ